MLTKENFKKAMDKVYDIYDLGYFLSEDEGFFHSREEMINAIINCEELLAEINAGLEKIPALFIMPDSHLGDCIDKEEKILPFDVGITLVPYLTDEKMFKLGHRGISMSGLSGYYILTHDYVTYVTESGKLIITEEYNYQTADLTESVLIYRTEIPAETGNIDCEKIKKYFPDELDDAWND